MANGITQGLTSLLGIDTNAGNAQLQQALQALQAVGVPTAEQLNLPELQKYVSAGVLTPQQYQAIMADPDSYTKAVQASQDNSGVNAQKEALSQLSDVVNKGGSTDINRANLANNLNQTNQAMQAARQGITEDAQQRGVAGGGMEFINKLMNEQGNAQNANLGAVNAGANNAQLALNALTQKGQLGGTMQGQANQAAQAQAQAAQQIAEYNSQLQSAANQYNTQTTNEAQGQNLANAQNLNNMNTQNANMRTQYNAQVPQQVFNDQIQKAGGIAGQYGNQANLSQQQAQMGASLTGGLIGAGSNLYGDYLKGQKPAQNAAHGGEMMPAQCYAMGGEAHDHGICEAAGRLNMDDGGTVPGTPQVPGDNEQNDVIPANLSPHEIVLPNSVTQDPNAPQKAAQFVGDIKGMTPSANSFSEILKTLEDNGIELRLCSKDGGN